MKIHTLVLSALLVAPLASSSDELGDDYERLVDEILETTGALKIGAQMSEFIVVQMTSALKSVDPNLPDRAYDILRDEVNLTIDDAIKSGGFQELMYPVYKKYLTQSDLEAMAQFYRSEAGRKIAATLPMMVQDSMVAGQIWGQSLGPIISERVQRRLAEEGFELP